MCATATGTGAPSSGADGSGEAVEPPEVEEEPSCVKLPSSMLVMDPVTLPLLVMVPLFLTVPHSLFLLPSRPQPRRAAHGFLSRGRITMARLQKSS